MNEGQGILVRRGPGGCAAAAGLGRARMVDDAVEPHGDLVDQEMPGAFPVAALRRASGHGDANLFLRLRGEAVDLQSQEGGVDRARVKQCEM